MNCSRHTPPLPAGVAERIEHGFLLNPRHTDFGQLAIGAPEPFAFDERLAPTRER